LGALVTWAIALALMGSLVGCASSGGVDAKDLNGTWVLESFGGPKALVPADSTVHTEITFQDGTFSGVGGVNTFGGKYEATDGGKLRFSALMATEMAGPPAAMDQEGKFFTALADTRVFEFNGDKLVLGDLGNNTLAVLAPK
jgi:putative lipoprotein